MVALFVYGTLRRPVGGPAADTHYHDRISGLIASATVGSLDGAELHDFGSYPGVLPGEGVVAGEVFEISEETLVVTDQIEGHPGFYTRRIERVCCGAAGDEVDAWVYWAPLELRTAGSRIGSGDWFDRLRRKDFPSINEQLLEDRSRLAGES